MSCPNFIRKRCCGIGAMGKPSGLPTHRPACASLVQPVVERPAARPNTGPAATWQPGRSVCMVFEKGGDAAEMLW